MAWLITSLETASRYSSGASFSSSTVLTTLSVMGAPLDEGFGVEGFEIGGHVGELRTELGGEIGRQRLRRLDLQLGHRAWLAEQEDLAAAHAQELAGNALG